MNRGLFLGSNRFYCMTPGGKHANPGYNTLHNMSVWESQDSLLQFLERADRQLASLPFLDICRQQAP